MSCAFYPLCIFTDSNCNQIQAGSCADHSLAPVFVLEQNIEKYTHLVGELTEHMFLMEQRDIIISDIQKGKKANTDINYLSFPKQSNIIALRPFIDQDGIIRVGNRGKYSAMPYDAKHPIIIGPNTRMSYLIINEAHYATGHGSVQVMTQYIRQNYWIHSTYCVINCGSTH